MKRTLLCVLLSAALGAQAQSAQQQSEIDAAQAAANSAEERAQAASHSRDQAQLMQDQAQMMADQARAAAEDANGRRHTAPTEQEQLAIAALEGLMSAPPERALPLLKRVLTGPQTNLVKMRALFVLSQIDNDEAQKLLLDLARSDQGELRLEAVRMIGVGGNQASLSALTEIYRKGDAGVRREVLNAYLIADRKQEVLTLAREAKDEGEARDAIQALGAMGALAELRQLGELGKHGGALVQAYAIAGDLASLRKLADSSADPAVRVDATRSIGIVSSKDAGVALRELYRTSKDADVRRAALEGLMIHGDQQGLLEIYRSSKDPQEKKDVLRQLTVIGGDAAMEAIDAALEGKSP